MKHNVENHPKFKGLQRELGRRVDVDGVENVLPMPLWQAKGLLESLWGFVAQNAIRGDIGRFTDAEICLGIEYGGDPAQLVAALVATGWLDVHPVHRLVVHDWQDHCAEYVKKRVARSGEGWATADGGDPSAANGGQRQPVSDNGSHRRTMADIGGQRQPPADNGSQWQPYRDRVPSTYTSDNKAEIEKITQSRFRGPESLASTLGSDLGGLTSGFDRDDLLGRIRGATGDGDDWVAWWSGVLGAVWGHDDAIGVVLDGLTDIANGTACPAERKAKDVGEITTPGRFLSAKILKWARDNKVKLPEMPHKRKGARSV